MTNFIQNFFLKMFARQLRKPSGFMAGKVGKRMNVANSFLYDFTLDTMELANGHSVLEIGFGNGKLFDKLITRAQAIKISGLDFSPDMVKQATRNNQQNISAGNLTLKFGRSSQIPYADASFDKVFCINVIYFWEDPSLHLREVHRVLKPGGKFYASIRTKESMHKLPFVKYGFIAYEENEWEKILEANSFQHNITKKTKEPEAKFEGKSFQIESLCIVGRKN